MFFMVVIFFSMNFIALCEYANFSVRIVFLRPQKISYFMWIWFREFKQEKTLFFEPFTLYRILGRRTPWSCAFQHEFFIILFFNNRVKSRFVSISTTDSTKCLKLSYHCLVVHILVKLSSNCKVCLSVYIPEYEC